MEIEVKKNEKGEFICELQEGSNAGTIVNISEMMFWLGDDLSNGILIEQLGIIGIKFAIYAIQANYISIIESEVLDYLLVIERLMDAISKSVTPADWYKKYREIRKNLDFYETECNQLKRDNQLLQESNEEKERLIEKLERDEKEKREMIKDL